MSGKNVLFTITNRFVQDRCLRVADSLSFTTILAVVPVITVVFSIMAHFPMFDRWMVATEDFIFQHFLPASSDTVREYLTAFRLNAGHLTLIGLFFLFVTSVLLMATIEEAFNDIYRTPKNRNPVWRIFSYVVVLVLAPMLFAVVLIFLTRMLSTMAGEFSQFALIDQAVGFAIPFVLELALLLLLYHQVPNRQVTWRSALIGGLVAAILLEIAKRGFAWFVGYSVSYQVIYGALAALPIFLFWVYISWVIILVGAVMCAVLNEMDAEAAEAATTEE